MSAAGGGQSLRTRVAPDYVYLQIACSPACVDAITWKMALTDALTSLGGLTGQASMCDIMYLSEPDKGGDNRGIVRCAADNADFVRAAVGGASRDSFSFSVRKHSSYLPLLIDP